MDIRQFLFEERRTSRWLSVSIDCTENAILKYKNGTGSPSLLNALKLLKITDGKVTLEELLSDKDKEEYEKWLAS